MNNQVKNIKNESAEPRYEPLLCLLLSAVSMTVILIALIIDKFIFPFGNEPLSPIIAQALILLVPAYILITLSWGRESREKKLLLMGIKPLRAEYIFLLVFTAFFAICTSLLFNMLFGGTYAAAKGFTLFGIFNAGENDFSVSSPYLALAYAIIPAIIEEIVFRGVIFGHLKSSGLRAAIVLSTLISAMFSFSPAQLPDAIICSLIFIFVYLTTDSLLSSVIVHIAVGLFRLFLQTNMSVYFTSSPNTTLFVTIVILAWLLSGALFFSEATRIYRARALEKQEKTNKTASPEPKKSHGIKDIWSDIKQIFSYKPTLITGIVTLALYAAITLIGII